ncbi:MAG TPA: 2-amino-4-hydroxy-6-hydroxymethyldihydropteridine diphosphokinase [Gammaproteobacteria bacterium]
MTLAYIGLGSNLSDPQQQLNQARAAIAELPDTQIKQSSSIYQSPAMTLDNEPQNDYLNAVIAIDTTLDAEQLLEQLQRIEDAQGRVRDKRWGARTIDLDILLYGDLQLSSESLNLPHAEIHKRRFVLEPLQQIAPQLRIPAQAELQTLLQAVQDQPLKKIGEFND